MGRGANKNLLYDTPPARTPTVEVEEDEEFLMYFLAPRTERQKIAGMGLSPEAPQMAFEQPRASGVYVFASQDMACDEAEAEGDCDIYEINIKGLQLVEASEQSGIFYSPLSIGTKRIQRRFSGWVDGDNYDPVEDDV